MSSRPALSRPPSPTEPETPADLTIGQLAATAGVRTDTVRYYERLGLLTPEGRTEAGYRLYGAESVERLRFIKKVQGLGFSLDEAERLLHFGSGGDPAAEASAGEVLELTRRKIDQLQVQIEELSVLKDALTELADRCPGEGPVSECPILEHLQATEA